MDVNQFFELGKQYWPFAITIIWTIGNAISWYFSIQKSRAEREKARVETQKMRVEIRKLQTEEQLQLESLRKAETGNRPSQTPSEREFPKLLKADWKISVQAGSVIFVLIVFFVDLFSSPLTAYVLANMMFLLFGALVNLLIIGFQALQRQGDNNLRILSWLTMETQRLDLELTHERAKLLFEAVAVLAQGEDQIIEQIKKLLESPGNH
jgi:hypothetical protein